MLPSSLGGLGIGFLEASTSHHTYWHHPICLPNPMKWTRKSNAVHFALIHEDDHIFFCRKDGAAGSTCDQTMEDKSLAKQPELWGIWEQVGNSKIVFYCLEVNQLELRPKPSRFQKGCSLVLLLAPLLIGNGWFCKVESILFGTSTG